MPASDPNDSRIPEAVVLRIEGVTKSFTLHLQGGQRLPVLDNVSFDVPYGACVSLEGRSGSGKSSVLKMAYGGYAVDSGSILLRTGELGDACTRGNIVDLATAMPRVVLDARRRTIGYVSQFLRAVPRVAALDVVASPLIDSGTEKGIAHERAAALLDRLAIPERLWQLPPATFSGGEQQRVNVARGFARNHPLLLLDEPTASLDDHNRAAVVELIRERVAAGTSVLAIFHDADVRAEVADVTVDIERFSPTASATA